MNKIALAALIATLAVPGAAGAQVRIKLGTLAPQGSTWHEILLEMAQRWQQASNGQVKLQTYAGGVQGSEGEMVRKMGINQLQAVSISNIGMHDILPEPQVMSVPMLFRDANEAECAFEKVRPQLEQEFDRKGYAVLNWSRVGTIHLFCDRPFRTPAEMNAAGARIFAWEGDPRSVDAFRAAGFSPVVLSSTDIVPSLQTGMIDCVSNVPLYVLTARLFEKANAMTDLPWGFIYGATLVRKDAWEKVPADLRPKLQQIAHELGQKVDVEVRKLNEDAVAAMQKQGLRVVPVDPAPWRAAMEKAYPTIRGGVVPAAFFDTVVKARDACRGASAR
ncbi:MAG TPA: TRAP transporter substrate-binding protein DctP [Anaeromyxobacteraceae bacterium]|nr:TRAP transporter substrate-binding protein DctP [Anaeromyxobacteraceae bacterium]